MDEHREGLKTALVIINMQQGVMDYCVHPKKVVSRIQDLVSRARDTGTPIYWVQDEREFERHSTPWRLAAGLEPQDDEHRIFKSYRDAFTGTGLHASLIAEDVGRLVICGAQSDYCLRTAAGRAAAMGYDVTVVRDAHTTGAETFEGQSLTGDQIIAHTNAYFATLDYPNQDFSLMRTDEVAFRPVTVDD
ncbi:cysteine hydrolase family protein [Paeniglutamicibacter psychrophenolicus]|uniref:Nicotinamidase-related amidase n=1 Tax=Paeniglutamicibacter psychrophenolicus TaxID=257454 RepID=A0ABS4WGR7_9MICC|nr:isochorismatase family protein [Paeniglutamicibacter psychrophenolicus]MBP2375143.1 nicotinamidase-related amidase [Paeniglutamicibacter psychrophenolicus]